MDAKVLLAKSVTLLYRESLVPGAADRSTDLVRTVLENIKTNNTSVGVLPERDVVKALKATVIEMCDLPQDHIYDKSDLLQRIKINCDQDEKLFEAIKDSIEDDINDGPLKRSILSIRKSISNHFRVQKISEILNKASADFKFNLDEIKDVNKYIENLQAELEPYQVSNTSKDPAIITELDLGDDRSLREILAEAQNLSTGTKGYVTGWQDFNKMIQGRLRPGESVVVGALQHKYKTGFTLSLFKQIAIYNKPLTADPMKKPLLLRISFEDAMVNNIQFLYMNLKYNETAEMVDISDISVDEMSAYVKERMQKTGFHVKMIRVDPTQWSYRSIINKIIEFESQGYQIEALFLDYLMLVPTTGCITTGPSGTDMRDLLRRIRNFCASKGILMVSPHQLSTEAKGLIRGGVPEDKFLAEVTEKGYHAGSKQLDQEMDLELYIHKFKMNGTTWLGVQRGKHRLPSEIEDDADKAFFLPFPKRMPIPDDINGERIAVKKIPVGKAPSNVADDFFS